MPVPPYQVRISSRAQKLALRLHRSGLLEVVAPGPTPDLEIRQLLMRHATWIECTLAKFRRQAARLGHWTPPTEILPPAISATWLVECEPQDELPRVHLQVAGPSTIRLYGPIENGGGCSRLLRRWLVRQGTKHLLPWLAALSASHDLPYLRGSVRVARTRWGSCSDEGVISLNAGLLLFPPPAVEYVLLHELCHTKEANHSPAFWEHVRQHCPDYLARRTELHRVGKTLPVWFRAA